MARLAVLICASLLLCLPALINGGPILFPDTTAYIIDGDRLFHLAAPLNVRPVFYGLAIRFLHWDRSLWPVLLAQGLIVAHLLMLTLRVMGAGLRKLHFVLLIAGLAVFTPLGWTISHVLPDAFAATLILSLGLLAFCADRLGRGERVYLVLLAAASACFHLTHLAIGLAIAGVCWAGWLLRPSWRPGIRPVLATAPSGLALLAFVLFSLVLYQRVSFAPNSPPFLLARVLADGPGRDYLRAACPEHPYTLCRYLDSLPDTEEGFLWRFLPKVPTADGKAIKAEADQVVHGTVAMFPGQVARHMLQNAATQLVAIRATLYFDQQDREGLATYAPFALRQYTGTMQDRGSLATLLPPINAVHAAVALAGLAACLWFGAAGLAQGLYRPALLIGTILFALVVNAVVSGALSGVFDRYQGRIVWLLPFAGVAAGIALSRSRVPVLREIAGTE